MIRDPETRITKVTPEHAGKFLVSFRKAESEILPTLSCALQTAQKMMNENKGPCTVLKCNDGSGHPSNLGKWFLHMILR